VQPYLHESRHAHAVARMRGPGGRFLTKEEKAAEIKKREVAEQAEKATANATQADGSSGSREAGALARASPSLAEGANSRADSM